MPTKIASINAKCSDMCSFHYSENGKTLVESHDYVPYELCIGGGDYVKLKIDIETGQIIGWNKDKFLESIKELQVDPRDE